MRGLPIVVTSMGALAIAGCGGPSGDLFAVQRSGSVPDANLRLIVNDDGTATCNGSPGVMLSAPLVIEARELQRELTESATDGVTLKPQPGSILRYAVQTPSGKIRFADNSKTNLPEFQRMAFFVRKVAQSACALAR